MVFCCAFNCSNRLSANLRLTKGITFHRFPDAKDDERRKRWIANLRRDNFEPTKNSRICSQHFVQEMFDRTGQNTRLKKDAVPTLFNFPAHLQKDCKTRRPPPKRNAGQSSEATEMDGSGDFQDAAAAREVVMNDHSYHISSPTKLKRKLHKLEEQNEMLMKKVKLEQTKKCKVKKSVKSLKNVVKALKDKHLVTSQCADLLHSTLSGVPHDLFERLLKEKRKGGKYSPQLRSFAMTLQFYSAKAYRFVRKSFDLGLPHPAVIRKWYSSISGEPGFTEEVFKALQAKSMAAQRDGHSLLCGLVMDEMSIRKHVEWDGKKFRGHVDLGTDFEDDDMVPPAVDAFVLMISGLHGPAWKVPCGYFLVNGLSGEEKANLVQTCLQKLNDVGIKIRSLTCDGPSSHFSMFRALGAKMGNPLVPTFPHPSDDSLKISIILDACHMLKLVRNSLADLGEIRTKEGGVISWKYIEALHALQEKKGLRLGNKLKSAHINWRKQKMKVNLAAQSLSSSVADALVFCKDELRLPQFEGCDATVQFILVFDRLFDILNSRNPLAKGFKSPLRASNFTLVEKFLSESERYIRTLTDKNGTDILQSRRKTGFLGFIVCIHSLKVLATDLLLSEPAPMKYLLTYRLSQDHIELFFAAVRSAGGFNNNPTASQFSSAYKRLLMRNQIEGGKGNCVAQDTTILETVEDHTRHIMIDRRQEGHTVDSVKNEANNEERCEIEALLQMEVLSEYKEAAITYIAGYVVRMVCKKIVCPECTEALFQTDNDITSGSSQFSLVHFKNRGGLAIPSPSVIFVCNETEKYFQILLKESSKLPKTGRLAITISTSLLEFSLSRNVFPSLNSHMLDSTPTTNHVISLIKACSESFVKIRMHHIAKTFNEQMNGPKIRKQFSKLILFKHQ